MTLMAKTRPERKDVDSYTIRGTNKVVRGKENEKKNNDFDFDFDFFFFLAGREMC